MARPSPSLTLAMSAAPPPPCGAPPTSRDSVLGVDVRVGPERDVFLKHGLLIKENYQTNKCDFRKYSKKNPAISVKSSKASTLNQISKKSL